MVHRCRGSRRRTVHRCRGRRMVHRCRVGLYSLIRLFSKTRASSSESVTIYSNRAICCTILMNKLYQLKTCNRRLPRDIGLERPCLNYHIKQCSAPCQGYVSREQYREQVGKALEFLNGNYNMILKELVLENWILG